MTGGGITSPATSGMRGRARRSVSRATTTSCAGTSPAFHAHPVDRVAVTEAHYVAGNAQPIRWARELASLGVVRHDVPVTPQRGEIGADVELALTCYQAACGKRVDAVVRMSGDATWRRSWRGSKSLEWTWSFR